MSQEENSLPNLNNDYKDYILAVTRGLVGAIPFAGSLIAEAITAFMPNQRADRLVQYLSILASKLEHLDHELLKARFASPGFINLLEDSVLQAVRALTAERLEFIATIVKNGLSDEQEEYDQYKYLLLLLAELNDTEAIILQSYLFDTRGDENVFYEKHKDLLMAAGAAHMGSPQEDVERSTVHKSYRQHIARLGLLQPKFKQTRKNELPEFDLDTGTLKASGYELTSLGDLFLRRLDLSAE